MLSSDTVKQNVLEEHTTLVLVHCTGCTTVADASPSAKGCWQGCLTLSQPDAITVVTTVYIYAYVTM